ncbi:NUDIX domain-containing protein [Kaarinaea lacus]
MYWDNPLPVVAAIVQYNNDVILARNSQWPKGMFSLITGFLEKQETPEQAVLREVKEELGLEAEVVDYIGHYSFIARNQLLLAFCVNATGDLRLGEEIAETKFLSMQQLKRYSFGRLSLTAEIVKDWFAKSSPISNSGPNVEIPA